MYTRFDVNADHPEWEKTIRVRLDNGIIVSGKPSEFEKLGNCNDIFLFSYGWQYHTLIEVLIWTDNIVK